MNRLALPAAMALLCLGTIGWSNPAFAQSGEASPPPSLHGLSAYDAVATALAHNPGLKSTALAEEQARRRVDGERAAFPWELQADGGYTHTESPSLGPQDSVVTSTNDSVTLGSQLDKTFPAGTGLSFRVQGDRYDTRRPASSLSMGDSSISRGIGYTMSARASLTQPLLQGRGRKVNLANLRSARIGQTQAERATDLAASTLVADVLTAYWEVWYAERAVQLEHSALELAQRQRGEAVARQAAGALAPVDVLPFETRVAELRESVVSAQANEQQRHIALEQLLGGTSFERLTTTPPEVAPSPREELVLQQLELGSPEIAELEQRVRLAESNAEVAGEAYRARLDLESYVEARGLGNRRIPPAVAQLEGLNAVSAHVGVVYRTPLDRRRYDAQRSQALLDVSIARSNLEQARQQLRANATTLISSAEASRAGLEAAQGTAEIAKRQFDAEQARFAAGASTPIQVQEAEDALRQARHRVERARVDLIQAEIELKYYTGQLQYEYAAAIEAL